MKKYTEKTVLVNDLKVNSKNNRTIGLTDYKRLQNSLTRYGQIEPLICDKDLVLFSGHQRLKVLKKNKVEKVLVWIVEGDDKLLKKYNELNISEFDASLIKFPEIKINIDVNYKDLNTKVSKKTKTKNVRIGVSQLLKNESISAKDYNDGFYKIVDQDFWNNFINWLNEKGILKH